MTLEKQTRDAIGRSVRLLRELFEGEFGKQASGRFGIRSSPRAEESGRSGLDAWLDPVESLSLAPAEFAQRDELIHALRYLTSEGNEPGEAVTRLIREAAFTAVNRLLAIRVAEAIGVLPPVLSGGRQSAGYRDAIGDLFPGLAHDPDSYWTYLQVAGDELAPGVPRLFDRRHPASAFVPSRACLDEALGLLTAEELQSAWAEPETLGWGYQFFNGDDVKQMRDASAAPRNSRELAVRNQFFTPRYVVDWLVQNTLGRRLNQAGYDVDLPLLVGEVDDHEPLALGDVRVLDPAVGSGHFLLGSYDLLEEAWQSTGVPPEDASSRILPCLFGVDIDPRAAQVAQAVLLLRARRSAPNADLVPPTIVSAVGLPHSQDLREQAFGGLSPAARHLADVITEALDQAPLLGSLLKVEQRLEAELASHRTAPRLAVDGSEADVVDELRTSLDELVSVAPSPEQRMFTAEATDALRFLDICQQRYDTILMNPPFGEGVEGPPRKSLQRIYPDWWTEVYACFLTRSFELSAAHGLVGMLSSSQYFITRKMRELRELIAADWPPIAIIDLGAGVLAGATVNTAVSVFGQGRSSKVVTYADLTGFEASKRESILQEGPPPYRRIDVGVFESLDRTPFAFHVPDKVLKLWSGESRLEPDIASVRKGNSTFDNFRFLRLHWEVPSTGGTDWRRYQKGGDYRAYLDPSHLVVDWRKDGRSMKEHALNAVGSTAQVMQSSDHWGLPGLTSPRISSVGYCARLLPSDEVFGEASICVFPQEHEYILALLGFANSTAFAELLRVFGRSRHTENGALKAMPLSREILDEAIAEGINDLVAEIIEVLYRWEVRDETSPLFSGPLSFGGPRTREQATDLANEDRERLEELQNAVDKIVSRTLGLEPGTVIDADVTRRPRLVAASLAISGSPEKDWAEVIASWAAGVAFGRWDSQLLPQVDPVRAWDLLAPLPPTPPVASHSEYAIVLGGRDDHDTLGRRAMRSLEKIDAALAEEVNRRLRGGSLETWIDQSFFAWHLRRYSRSRRYAPVYWQLVVPSKRWGLWVYAPALSRESLFAIARAAHEKLTSVGGQVRLSRESSEPDREARERAEALEVLAAEVEKFAAVADQVAQSGWEPDLSDGFVLNAAPIEELFVDKAWRGQIAKHRRAMQQGEYPWATVQREYFEKRT